MKIIILAAVAALAVTPAFAAGGKKKPHHHRAHGTHLHVTPHHSHHWHNSQNSYRSMNVYSHDGRLIGRDPDPNIRQSLRDEDWRFRYGR